jgi:trimethylamine--corrinoid protein Co-methyltransferase
MGESIGGKYGVLTEGQIAEIHQAALEVLQRVGLRVESKEFLKIYGDGGAESDFKNRIVKIPAKLVEEALKAVPHRVVLHGRKPEYKMDLTGDKVHLGTGGAAVGVLDLETGEARPTTLQDQAQLARLVEGLENIHFFQCPVVPRDVSADKLDINSFYAALANTCKNVQESAHSPQAAGDVIELAAMIAGSEERLREAPFISFVTSWMVSPLKLDTHITAVLREVVQSGIPVALSSAPITGSTAPITLAGLLTQVHAEELSGIILTQLIREGAPVLYGPVPGAANLRNMSFAGGAIETALMDVAAVQMAHYIGVPIYSDAGETDSKLPDIQAGYEKAASIILVALAGGNYIHHAAGMMEGMITVAYEQYVIDNDILGMALRALQGIEVDRDHLSVEVIEHVGPGGNYLIQDHTIKHLRSNEFFIPHVADRQGREAWEAGERLDGRTRARQRAKEILSQPAENLIPEDLDQEIRKRFDILLPRE